MYKNITVIITLPLVVLLAGRILVTENNSDPTPVRTVHNIEFNVAQHMLFQVAGNCMSCHNDLITPSGEDISIGSDWRASMMANSARDPYWHAAVRREVLDHPESQSVIENECATCHMPMAHYQANAQGEKAEIFSHLPANRTQTQQSLLAMDGVSCTTCHQITDENFGERESFVGGFVIDTLTPLGQREIYGPYPVDSGRSTIMHSSSGFNQVESKHIQQSELCATCHTLYTHPLNEEGEVIGELPEQVPYLEWQHSSFMDKQSCQSCHMPVVQDSMPISSVWGQPRAGVSRHAFRGGNFFMINMLNRYRDELGVQALPQEMSAAVNNTIDHLQTMSATIAIDSASVDENGLIANVSIENLAGHKLPTAYPSRRVWIRFTVRNQNGDTVFESGAIRPDGSIVGNDNDGDDSRYEPHYTEIGSEDEVQIYEAIMVDQNDEVTTGLLSGVRYIKDNRILPLGFDKTTAHDDIAVQGSAYKDNNFLDGRDRVRYRVGLNGAEGPLQVKAELYYQPIAFRWAHNLEAYDAPETNRFVGYYKSMSKSSSVVLASTEAKLE